MEKDRYLRTCNNCPYLNITEEEQDRLRELGEVMFHICNRYGKRVFHYDNMRNHDANIYPCSECIHES